MKINLFSPAPPTKSDIARQSASLLPHLAKRADVALWLSETEWDRSLEKHATVRHYDWHNPPWREINAADITFFQIGNDPRYHEGIWQISRQHPGVVILHDVKLQHFFAGLATETMGLSRREYLGLVELHHSLGGRSLAEEYLNGHVSLDELAEECPLTGAAIEQALAVIVHSEAAYESLTQTTSLPIAYLPLCAAAPPAHQPLTRDDSANPDEPYRLIVFGFLGPNRRLPVLLKALAGFAERDRFRLDVYGTMDGAERLEQLICRLGLSDIVTMHGFVPGDELNAALRRSDLAINLRLPSMGETSGSQLHLWQFGLPSLVTQTGWYATLSEEMVAFVRPEHELEDIQRHLADFMADPEKFRAQGRNAFRYVNAECTTEAYVDGLVKVAEQAPEFQSIWIARELARRAGAAMNAWGATAADELLPRMVQEIRGLVSTLPPQRIDTVGVDQAAVRESAKPALQPIKAAIMAAH